MMNALLELVPPADRALVQASAAKAAQDNDRWARALLGSAGAKLCENLALVMASTTPALDQTRLQVRLRFCLWTILLDDRLDDPARSDAELSATAASVGRVLECENAIGSDDPLLSTLVELLAELRHHDRGGALLPHLIEGLAKGIAGGVAHATLSRRVARGLARAPSAEEYLHTACQSINYRSVALALLLLVNAERGWTGDLERLDRALTLASRAIRLANDVSSVERDQRDGLLNVLLLENAAGVRVTRGVVQRQIDRYVRVHDKLVHALPGSPSGTWRKALIDSLRYSVGVYRVGDLR